MLPCEPSDGNQTTPPGNSDGPPPSLKEEVRGFLTSKARSSGENLSPRGYPALTKLDVVYSRKQTTSAEPGVPALKISMSSPFQPKQSDRSVEKNVVFFRDRLEDYESQINALDTYRNIREAINMELSAIDRLLDIGNGGTFDYDVSLVGELVAVDLFLEHLPPGSFPANVFARNGSALDLPFSDASFDGVIMVMLIHHLIGTSVEQSWENATRAVDEAFRVLKPSGKLIVVESCVPPWFYKFEKFVFPVATNLIGQLIDHPATLQFPPAMIAGLLERYAPKVDILRIPTGRWLLQYGWKYPSVLTPVNPYLFTVSKV